MSTDGPYTVSEDFEFHPKNVDASKCGHTTQSHHECVHDWRIHWGNVPRTEEE